MKIYILSIFILGVYGFLMWRFRNGIHGLTLKQKNPDLPIISVIIALKNEESNVHALMQSLDQLDYPKELFEIILVDDHSSDCTAEILSQYKNESIQVYLNTQRGKKSAILTGISYAKGDWVAVTDADCLVPKSWLQALAESRMNHTKMVLGPVFILDRNRDFLELFQQMEFLGLQGATAGAAGVQKPISANGANMLFHKNTFNEIKPFEDNMHLNTGDDQFLMMKMASEMGPESITYCWDEYAVVRTQAVQNWRDYFKQRIRWASKGKSYKDLIIVSIGIVVVLSSLLVGFSIIFSLVSSNYVYGLSVLSAKLLLDLSIILPAMRLAQNKFHFFDYVISGVIYPFVVMITVISGLFRKT